MRQDRVVVTATVPPKQEQAPSSPTCRDEGEEEGDWCVVAPPQETVVDPLGIVGMTIVQVRLLACNI